MIVTYNISCSSVCFKRIASVVLRRTMLLVCIRAIFIYTCSCLKDTNSVYGIFISSNDLTVQCS